MRNTKSILLATVLAAFAAQTQAQQSLSRPAENVTVFREAGRYGGWPANHGLWQWGDEIVVGFQVSWYKHNDRGHAVDFDKPHEHWQARSLDGGQTWVMEKDLRFVQEKDAANAEPLAEPLDFTAPAFALMFRFGGLHAGPSWFYASADRCRTWRGPYSFAVPGVSNICTRTDLVILGPRDCLMFGSAAKSDGKEGRVFCARTADGGMSWRLVGWIGEEPAAGDFAIMPSTVRLPGGALLTAVRYNKPGYDIRVFRSGDLGKTWEPLGSATGDIGSNPPAMVLLKDGRVCLTYGYRRKPFGMRARLSGDGGRTWGDEIVLRDDGLTGDLGYPRSLARPDGSVLTIYYFNGPRDEDRTIQATRWSPPAADAAALGWVNTLGMRLARIAPGRFTMGQEGPEADYRMMKHPGRFDDADWDERPAHRVTLTRGFLIGATEVTLGQYRRFKPGFRPKGGDDEAARGMSWHDAVAFCAWLTEKEGRPYRLPTEAEWEHACRAGTATLFSSGDTLPSASHVLFGGDGGLGRYFENLPFPAEYRREKGRAVPLVAQGAPNASGLYDMHGNVAEWCADWYGPYAAGDQTDPQGPADGDFKVFRGGHFSTFTRMLRSANRSAWIPETECDRIGFRVVMDQTLNAQRVQPAIRAETFSVKRSALSVERSSRASPFFSGPRPFVIVPPGACGPSFAVHNHSPSVAECPNGDLLAVWYSCVEEPGSELCNLASRLRPGAEAWTQAEPFWDGADVNDHAPKVWADAEGTLYHFARGLAENIVRTSADSGATWTKARIVQPVGEFGNAPLRLRDGTLVLGNDMRGVSLVYSRDGGKTWEYNEVDARAQSETRPGGTGPRYPGIHAPMVQLADGGILAMSRNDAPEDQARFGFKTPMSVTRDLGKTWTFAASEFPAISSVQRAAMIRLREGPILFCSFTDQWRDWKTRKGMTFAAAGGKAFTGYGLFAALSFDEGKTWPVRRLVTPGGPERQVNGLDRVMFTLGDTQAEPCGYLALTQTRDRNVQLITSRNHYVFNLAWLKENNGVTE
jgi:formylglycine-generating enzyme required for sulfatase activity